MAEEKLPSEEDLLEALDKVGVSDVLLNALSATASIGFRRVAADARDLPQRGSRSSRCARSSRYCAREGSTRRSCATSSRRG